MLVDGSTSISDSDFKIFLSVVSSVVSAFHIGPDRVQIGLVQFSYNPQTEWHLNAFQTEYSLLQAINRLKPLGGDTNTGMALNFTLQNNFQPDVGMRADSKKIVVLLTDGKSQDDTRLPSQNLKDAGIEIYAIGVKNANELELKSIASKPFDIHTYSVADFSFLPAIVDNLTINLCNSAKSLELVRLVGGASRCAGTLEVKRGEWRPVYGSNWILKSAAAVCRELDCGSAVSTRSREDSSDRPGWEISSDCVESGSALRECVSSGSSSSIMEITCSDPAVVISRLVVLPLLFIAAICFIHKATRGQKPDPQENVELDYYNLGVCRAEGGPAEEEGAEAAE
ncbi:collagen alpha-1(XII) chain-like isoform X2 [Micropterus salmoides]|uniref:collagen alpha-1(XII) chain-like isoform X2 n=1 Tax=Micropterus salmoides TaxID=27706 RepID=UPI0018EBCE5F|nr:collagen alpha-1(XII) chain-like isoform X2 [Micropterus salmoides]